ncbi:hypothetical protein KNP414_05635 [Paenibacillus mucilaginosus KNP414]|uniref:Uncharacterized protein n=1 Tax=Paenibacillus mucilaginosus (strain KNP414) TaxID=1036673 RepID=F8FLN2_PAEMK|nr:hypothetical protein KNP414_05635 [Paenibacillus mucilaginosus KNP414]
MKPFILVRRPVQTIPQLARRGTAPEVHTAGEGRRENAA